LLIIFNFFILLFVPAIVHAQESRWYDDFFIESSVHRYFAPKILDELVQPKIGFRGALGYEYNRFRFAIESGYTTISGINPLADTIETDPLVLDARFVPLAFKFGYALPIRWGLGVQADLSMGFMFSRTAHYETVVDLLIGNKKDSRTTSPLAGARLYATYTLPRSFLKIYAGGGIDALFETDGPIPMPLIEAGISFKPLMLIPRRTAHAEAPTPETGAIAPEDLVFSHTPENIVIEENERGRTVRLLNAVYFEADSVNMIERYRPILDEAGRRLRSNPGLRITLRAYAAPFGTADGQVAVSAARAWFCVEYFMRQYGIAEARMKIEYYGAERAPEFVDANWESYRCVEFLIGE
jgi:outer membrane protein OmpA-like peptidoglycan-associated protein